MKSACLCFLAPLLFLVSSKAGEPPAKPGGNETRPQGPPEADARRVRLLETLEVKDPQPWNPVIRHKVIRELIKIGVFDERYCKAMIVAAQAEKNGWDWGASKGLAAAGERAVPVILKHLEANKPSLDELQVLYALGSMGTAAKAAIPALQKMLDDKDMAAEVKAAVRVVLANSGWESKDNLAWLLKNVRDKTKEGQAAVQAMSWIGVGEWGNQELATELGRWIRSQDNAWDNCPPLAGLAVGSMGARGQAAVKPLQATLKTLKEKGDTSALPVIYWAALARVAPEEERPEAVRMMLKSAQAERETLGTIIQVTTTVADDAMCSQIVRLLSDKDPAVVKGAVGHITVSGREDPQATAGLLKLLQRSKDDYERASFVMALSMAASVNDLAQLEKLAKEEEKAEENEEVKKALAAGIAILKLDWDKLKKLAE